MDGIFEDVILLSIRRYRISLPIPLQYANRREKGQVSMLLGKIPSYPNRIEDGFVS
jgi:hypothetical protein